MGLTISTLKEETDVEKYTVTERLYVDAEDRLVPEGDPRAARLYSTPGKRIPLAEARRLGLVKTEKKAEPAKDKQADKPADKKAKPSKNKRAKAESEASEEAAS